jgi:hypothetical protein
MTRPPTIGKFARNDCAGESGPDYTEFLQKQFRVIVAL